MGDLVADRKLCPACRSVARKRHCPSSTCTWLQCEPCRVVWDPRRGTWFQRNPAKGT